MEEITQGQWFRNKSVDSTRAFSVSMDDLEKGPEYYVGRVKATQICLDKYNCEGVSVTKYQVSKYL